MKIGVFTYNFKHHKTQMGLFNLFMSNFKPTVAFAANPVELNFYKSKIRTGPKDLYLQHPKDICNKLGVDYHVTVHNSNETQNLIKDYDLDVGIVLGARILKSNVINAFKLGVINMHPGLLPENRGLDNLKWAILKKIPQGVTSHFIDSKIDKGNKILREQINIYKDDSLVDLQLRIQNLEQDLMIKSLEKIKNENNVQSYEKLGDGNYYKSVPPEQEKNLLREFDKYKTIFGV